MTAHIEPADPDEVGFVSYCPELGISSQGETLEEALRNIRDAVDELLMALDETGDLQDFLVAHSVTVYRDQPQAPGRVETTVKTNAGEVVSAFVTGLPGARVA